MFLPLLHSDRIGWWIRVGRLLRPMLRGWMGGWMVWGLCRFPVHLRLLALTFISSRRFSRSAMGWFECAMVIRLIGWLLQVALRSICHCLFRRFAFNYLW